MHWHVSRKKYDGIHTKEYLLLINDLVRINNVWIITSNGRTQTMVKWLSKHGMYMHIKILVITKPIIIQHAVLIRKEKNKLHYNGA